jgi:hypothetical protein
MNPASFNERVEAIRKNDPVYVGNVVEEAFEAAEKYRKNPGLHCRIDGCVEDGKADTASACSDVPVCAKT